MEVPQKDEKRVSKRSFRFEDVYLAFGPDREMSLDLKLPDHKAEVATDVDEASSTDGTSQRLPPIQPRETLAVTEERRGFWGRCRPIWFPLTAWTVSLIFTIIYSMFIHRIVIVGNPRIGNWIFEASLSNLLLSIVSQLYGMLLMFVVQSVLDALRWALASRPGRGGASASSFFQLSPATDWLSVFKFIYDSRLRNLWGVLRLSLPFMGLGFGSILKFQNSFEDFFIGEGPTIDVYAGNIPPDISILNAIPASYMAGFHDTWAQQLLSYPRYATSWPMDDCNGNCSSFFLPGGMEIARKVGPSMDSTILQGGIFNEADSISIEGAPGLAAQFDDLDDGFEFDIDSDCTEYITPEELNDGLQLCVRQLGDSIAAAWRACPNMYAFTNRCNATDLWASDPSTLVSTTHMAVFRQNATTQYDRDDLAIRHIEATSSPDQVHISADESRLIWDRIFVPGPDADTLDLESINITVHRLAWKYRTYTEFFPDHDVHVELLRNFLSVPLQFAVTAMQYANYTGALPAERDTFPPELLTTATGGRSIERFVSPHWTAWTFIIGGVFVVLVSGGTFLWILSREHPVPRPSGITEVDFASKLVDVRASASGSGLRAGGKPKTEGAELEGFTQLVQDLKEREKYTAWNIVKTLRGRRMELTTEVRPDGGVVDGRWFPVLRMVSPHEREPAPETSRATTSRASTESGDGKGDDDSGVCRGLNREDTLVA